MLSDLVVKRKCAKGDVTPSKIFSVLKIQIIYCSLNSYSDTLDGEGDQFNRWLEIGLGWVVSCSEVVITFDVVG